MDGLEFIRLGINDERDTDFDCGDPDLNEFFQEDSKANCGELLSVTYAWRQHGKTIAFFSVSNDAITSQDVENFNSFRRILPNRKRYKTMPAVKIGRFAVHKDYKKQKYGSRIMDFIKIWFISGNKTGCRFVIVDALNKSDVLPFYENNGFSYLTEQDKNEHTRLMYFDLKKIASAV